MDEPIIYRCRDWAPNLIQEPECVEDEMLNVIKLDDEDKFLRLLDHPEVCCGFHYKHKLLGLYDVNCMLSFDAPQIAMLFINGETKGYIQDDRLVFKDGWTPLHLACATSFSPSPKLVKYLIQRGDPLDVRCDYPPLNLKQATPLDLALEVIDNGYKYEYYQDERPWTLRRSMFELLYYVCHPLKECLEVIRLLVQNTENKERIRKAFIDSANEGKFVKVVALYLAAPELFLSTSVGGGSMSSIDELYLNLNSLDKPTYINDGLSLLLDVFDLVGHMLIAYVRLDDPKVWDMLRTRRCGFFLREVAHKKLGISSRDDYLLSLFKRVSEHAFEPPCLPPIEDGMTYYSSISWYTCEFDKSRKLDIDYVNRRIPNLKPHEEDDLRKAIDNKLSVMPNICTLFKGTTRIPNKWVNERFFSSFQRSIRRSIELHMARSWTEVANVKHKFNLIPIQSRAMNLTKLESFISHVGRSRIGMIAKRLIK